ncbi:MAG: hypothetical protein F4Z06_15480 [Acidimicrobiia bacterium]|nr:hypothetical protein [Acidimicrobiia bacterium]MYE73122.1 hypothetical protein [Acidimicrobiia bacterium]MYJ61776.1 hypothetical protein [Acidimicrobiia bacterium]
MTASPTLSDLFADGAETVEHRGRDIRPILRLAVSEGTKVRVVRMAARPDRRQALKLAAVNGLLEVNGATSEVISLWSDTSPAEVELTVLGARARRLEVWNAWDLGGLETSWLGNAGMIVEQAERHLALHCSDGLGPPSFTDLQVRLSVAQPG